ncbi:MAG: FliM/FliN family flagellar motor switch protein [Rhizobiales bacterium]|nr:FliM/FliN family flagellar motor switch protein [Hyphomicrobiales bacterium]
MSIPKSPGRRPVTAALFRSLTEVPVSGRPEVVKLFDGLSALIFEELASFATITPRIDLDEIAENLTPATDALALMLVSQRGRFGVWVDCDRRFVLALAEMSFGGSGNEPAFELEDRPPSKIEARLREHFLAGLAAKLPEVLAEALGQTFRPPADDTKEDATTAPPVCVGGSFLVNIFGYSSEIRVLLNRRDLAAILPRRSTGYKAAEPVFASNVRLDEPARQALVEVKVLLSPETLSVGEIGALRPGQLIRLACTAHTPVRIVSENVAVCSGSLTAADGFIAVRIENP